MRMDAKQVKNLLMAAAVMFKEKRDELAKLDSVIGDGDHGISMARGAAAAFRKLDHMPDQEPMAEYFKIYGRTLIAEIGGAIGPLFGVIFTEFGKCTRDLDELTAGAYAKALEGCLQKIMEFGGAKPNDKTMVDALYPAAQAAREAAGRSCSLTETAAKAAEAAKEGMKQTIPMRSRRGRSKYLQEKSIGHQDAGATSVYLLLNRMAGYFAGEIEYVRIQNSEECQGQIEKPDPSVYISKFINHPDTIIDEMVQGYIKVYGDRIRKLEHADVIVRKNMSPGKVGVVIGNGSGHEPACLGFVGDNMLDANAYGGVFAAPGPYTILEAIKAADTGKGVCVLVSSHAGDILNSKMAIDMAEDEGIRAEAVLLYDDISSAPKAAPVSERRGSIGTLFNYKMTPYYAKEHSMEEIIAFAEKVRDRTRSIVAAMTPGTSPVTGEKMFETEPGEVLVGLGVHGESALMTYKNKKCSDIAEGMISSLVEDMPYQKGDEVSVIVNGTGRTTMMELMIFYTAVEKYLTKKGIRIFKPLVGSFITTQEMGGIGLAVCKMDKEMKEAWTADTRAPQFPNFS